MRTSHQWCSIKKALLKNFTLLTGSHLCLGSLFNKACNFIKKKTSTRAFFPLNIAKFLRTPNLKNIYCPVNTPCVFHAKTTWKQLWSVYRVLTDAT